jgi:alpha-glucosidase
MLILRASLPFLLVSAIPLVAHAQDTGQHQWQVASPNGQIVFNLSATWDEVRVIDGLPMQHITLARRSGTDWYVGSLTTNWEERNARVPLSFLGDGKYVAEIYADAPDAAGNATHITFSKRPVDRTTVLDVHMVSGGGNAIWIHPAGAKP